MKNIQVRSGTCRGTNREDREKTALAAKKTNMKEQAQMRRLLGELDLNTVCQQALCPNIGECFSCGQATFLILGKDCTRQCSFCNVEKGGIPQPPDADEPRRVAEAVLRLRLSHVVVTSPTRDDSPTEGPSSMRPRCGQCGRLLRLPPWNC